ncbi:MAG: AAA family ATPase [Desulfomonile sp.]|nr:AAA family ATPase [Desulfomonile sp.]
MSDLDRLIRALSNPRIYPHGPESVQVIHTHISVVFVAGDLVYKVKKPVDFGFLDFTTLDKRRFFCGQEVRLNSRFSEGIYLGVAGIYDGPRGINLGGQGEEIETAVLMRRIPEEFTLTRMLEDDRVTPKILDRIADRIAQIHAASPSGPQIAVHGSFEVIRQNVKENFDQTEVFIGRTINRATYEAIQNGSVEFMRANRGLFQTRVARGFIRDCHGDLHLDHVIVMNGISLVDCIEFNDRFRFGDTASDLGFLLMDLDFHGFPAYAVLVAKRYAETANDPHVLDLLGFYKSYRAFVRGKVLGFALDEPEVPVDKKEAAARTAEDYFRLSLASLKQAPPPSLVVMCGLTGAGKSFLAVRLAKRLGAVTFRSDVIRKEIHGIPTTEHRLDKYGVGIYSTNATGRTYQVLLDRARTALERQESVILDASFMRGEDRAEARRIAEQARARFFIIECTCTDEMAEARLIERLRVRGEPSDGRMEIFAEQKMRFEPIHPDECRFLRRWDSSTDPNAFLKAFIREVTAPE